MLRLAGAENVVTAFAGFRPLTAEAVAGAAPDVIVIPERGLESLGGIEGLLTSGGQTPEALLRGLFQGVTGSGSQRDFRNVSLNLGGTTEAPRISNLKIEQPLEPKGEAPAQGKDVQAAPEKTGPTDPGQAIQQEILKQIFGN